MGGKKLQVNQVDNEVPSTSGTSGGKKEVFTEESVDSSDASSEEVLSELDDKHMNSLMSEASVVRGRTVKVETVLNGKEAKKRKKQRKIDKKDEDAQKLAAKHKKMRFNLASLYDSSSSSDDEWQREMLALKQKKKKKASKKRAEWLRQMAELSDSDENQLSLPPKKKVKVTELKADLPAQNVNMDKEIQSEAYEKEEAELLAKLQTVRNKKVQPAASVASDYGPSKPAMSIDENSLLFNSSDILHHNKLSNSIEEKLKEGEHFAENFGHVVGTATIDMRIKKVIWDGGYIDLGWLAPSLNL